MMNMESADKTQGLLDKYFEKWWGSSLGIFDCLEITDKLLAKAAFVRGVYDSIAIREEMQLSSKVTAVEGQTKI